VFLIGVLKEMVETITHKDYQRLVEKRKAGKDYKVE
jgi:hypothetical protein